jgi:hypothetical protein
VLLHLGNSVSSPFHSDRPKTIRKC